MRKKLCDLNGHYQKKSGLRDNILQVIDAPIETSKSGRNNV